MDFDINSKTLTLKVKSKPEHGKANTEIVEKLSKFFNTKVKLIKGFKSNKKTIIIDKPWQEIQKQITLILHK